MSDLQPDNSPGGEELDQQIVDDPESTVSTDEPDTGEQPQANESDKYDEELYNLKRMNNEATQRLAMLEDFLVKVTKRDQSAVPEPEPEIDYDDPASILRAQQREFDRKLEAERQRNEQRWQQDQLREFNRVKRDADKENADIVKRFQNEIDEYYRNNPEQRYNPDSYPTVLKYFKGELYDEQRRSKQPRTLNANPSPPRAPRAPEPEKFEYTPEQERLARIYGMLEGKDIIEPEEWARVESDRINYPGRRGGRGGK